MITALETFLNANEKVYLSKSVVFKRMVSFSFYRENPQLINITSVNRKVADPGFPVEGPAQNSQGRVSTPDATTFRKMCMSK